MDAAVYLRFVAVLLLVLALIVALAWIARRAGLGTRIAPNAGKRRRLSIVEVAPLDARHKLVLIRRDAVEHLVLLGPNQDLLVEGGIPAPDGADGTAAAGARSEFETTLADTP